MSMFNWLFRKPSPSKRTSRGAAPGHASAADATVPLAPGQPLPPPANPAMNRKNERIERRELLYLVVRDTMVRSSVLSASYKFKVLSLDQQGKQFLIMIDLAHEYGGDTARLSEIEALIAQTAKGRFDIVVTAVYWRVNEHVAVGKPQMAAQAPAHAPAPARSAQPAVAAATAAPAPPPPAPVAPTPALAPRPARRTAAVPPPLPAAAPVEPLSPVIGSPLPAAHSTATPLLTPRAGSGQFDPIEADEVAAFKRALGQAASAAPTPSAAVPLGVTVHSGPRLVAVSSPTGFEDTQMPEAGHSHDLGRTQYGDLM